MRAQVMRQLRSLQSRFPALRPANFAAYNLATSYLGLSVDPEFRLLGKLGKCALALDIGGNWGQSICALQRFVKPARIVSFEPNLELAARLTRKFANDPRVRIESVALGKETGSFDLFVPRYRSFIYDGLASLSREQAASWLDEDRLAGFNPDLLSVDRQGVTVARLDDFGLAPDVIKIDVQGLEWEVVQGARETIATHRPAMMIETQSEQVAHLLAECGLERFGLKDGRLIRKADQLENSLFLTEDHLRRINCG